MPVTEREVALDRAPEELAVLLGQGPVESEGRPHDLVVRLGALRPQVERGGISGEMDHEEHGERDGHQDGGRPGESLTQVGDHAETMSRVRGFELFPFSARSILDGSATCASDSSQL